MSWPRWKSLIPIATKSIAHRPNTITSWVNSRYLRRIECICRMFTRCVGNFHSTLCPHALPELATAGGARAQPRPGTPKTTPVGLRGPGELIGHLSVVVPHPDGFPVSDLDDADTIGLGRVGAQGHHVGRVDVHSGSSNAVHELCNHRHTSLG